MQKQFYAVYTNICASPITSQSTHTINITTYGYKVYMLNKKKSYKLNVNVK